MAEDDQISGWITAQSSTSLGLQTAYLMVCLVVAVGCGLLVMYLVYKKEYLQKPCNYLRCSLAVYDIIFMCCIIPTDVYILFQTDESKSKKACWVRGQLYRWFGESMSGTYLLMAMELYYFICQPLHYHQKVTTKRVAVGTLVVLALSLLSRVLSITIESLENPNTTSQCGLQSVDTTGPTAVIQHIMTGLIVLAYLIISISYLLIFKEAKKQQQRDENRDLWLYQTKAFKKLAPHAISLAVWVGTLVLLVVMTRQNALAKQEASSPMRITTRIAVLLYMTLSSMVNPIVYSFRMPDFRRALRETFGWPSNAPVALAPPPHGQQRQDLETAVFSGPVHGQGGSTIEVAEAPPSSRLQMEEDTSSTTRRTNKAGSSSDGAGRASKMMQTEGTPSTPSLSSLSKLHSQSKNHLPKSED